MWISNMDLKAKHVTFVIFKYFLTSYWQIHSEATTIGRLISKENKEKLQLWFTMPELNQTPLEKLHIFNNTLETDYF